MLRHHCGWTVALKRKPAGDHFIQDDPKRVDITALIARVATHLFGCNVEWYPKLSSRECGIGRSQEPCKAKVGENGFAHGVACGVLLVEQNIGGFEVAVNHPLLMSVIDSEANRGKKLHNLCWGWNVPLA